jgi:ABC-type uncharacterized transport system involved in gliding motility auxiliary subunit
MLKRAFDIILWLALTLALAGVALRFMRPDWPYLSWLAGAVLLCVLVYTLGQWREIARLFGGRQARLGSISIASLVVVVGILVAINYISKTTHKRWDLTASGQFTLSPQTVKVLKGLDSPLTMTVFARETETQSYKDRLGEYEYTTKNVSIEYVDPYRNPRLARQLQIQSDGTVAIQYKDRIERVTGTTEQDITNGIIKVVTGKERKVYFTQGHGEKDPQNSDRPGYSSISTAMTRDNYKVERLPLAQQGEVPADAAVVVVAGPKTDLLPGELDALKRYLDKGGKLLLLLDPPERLDSPPLTGLIALARDWGIEVGNNIIVDISGVGRLIGTGEEVPVAVSYPSHPIVQGLDVLTAFPLARSVSPAAGGAGGRTAQPFVETSPNSWAETDLKTMLSTGKSTFDADKGDKRGPLSLAAAVSAPVAGAPAAEKKPDEGAKAESRVVVFGDSDFASNLAFGISGNRDLFMNTINWLAQQENLIAIRPKEPGDQRLTMTESQVLWVTFLLLIVVPFGVFGSGIYAWWRRR